MINIFLLLLTTLSSNTSPDHSSINKVTIPPPGCVEIIVDSLYADKTEITNIGYREYQFWVKNIFGRKSKEYTETLLDTKVWKEVRKSRLSRKYHKEQLYSDYPVVGVTLAQAKAFSEWRTERVMEKIIIDSGIMIFDRDQDSSNYFTFDKFMNGDYIYKKGEKEFTEEPIEILLVEYKIPTSDEWEFISGYQDNILEVISSKVTTGTSTLPVSSLEQNKYGLYGVIGNVSELIDEDRLSKGGNWTQQSTHFSAKKNNTYTKPNCWTGFRNICTIEKVIITNER